MSATAPSISYYVIKRRRVYISLINKELIKSTAKKEFDAELIKICSRFLKKYLKPEDVVVR